MEVTEYVLFLEVPGRVKPKSSYLVAGLKTYELFVFHVWCFEVAANILFPRVSCKAKKFITFGRP